MKISHNDRVDIIKAYENELVPVKKLSEKYNVTRQAIYKVLKQSGIDTSKRLIQVSCTACGAVLDRHKARIRKQKNHFCDYECYYAFLNAGNPYIQNRHGQRTARRVVSEYFELQEGHVVHHIDNNNYHNLPSNLMVFTTQGDHIRHHRGFDVEPLWDGSKLSPSEVAQSYIIQ